MELVEQFDVSRYNRNATMAENLLFGTPVGKVFNSENLAMHPYVREVLDKTGLTDDLLRGRTQAGRDHAGVVQRPAARAMNCSSASASSPTTTCRRSRRS